MKTKLLARYPLGNSRRLWTQDRFILSTFNPGEESWANTRKDPQVKQKMRRAMETCCKAGFNLLELGWSIPAQSDTALEQCDALGVDILYQNMDVFGGMGDRVVTPFREEALKETVERLRPYRHVLGYYAWDEPYHPAQMQQTRQLMDYFQQKDPQRLMFTLMLPSQNPNLRTGWTTGAFPEYVRRFTKELEPSVLSFDYYPFGPQYTREVQLDVSGMWQDMAYIGSYAQEQNIPFWFYYVGKNVYDSPEFPFSMVRMSMYAGALHGAKALQQYTAWNSVVGPDGGPGATFEDTRRILEEFRNLGKTLMALSLKQIIHDPVILQIPHMSEMACGGEESSLLREALPHRIAASQLDDAYGNHYLLVLNRDCHKAQNVQLQLREPSRVYLVSKEDGLQYVQQEQTQVLPISLEPGDGALYRLQPADEEAFGIEYYLEKQ